MDTKIATSLSLMRRLPPNKIEQNLTGLTNLIPQETDELLQRIDQPLTEDIDVATGKKFLLCDYNRDGDSYRSPWSNTYQPAIDDGFLPSEKLRAMEMEANDLFDAYRELYFEAGSISSVYLWDLDNGFAGCFLIKKRVQGNEFVKDGCWDSIHIVEAIEESSSKATYKLTTTVIVHMGVDREEVGNTTLSGTLTRQTTLTSAVNETKTHLANIGRLIEDMEYDMRSNLNELYILKTREVISSMHRVHDGPSQGANFVADLNKAVMGHGTKRVGVPLPMPPMKPAVASDT